MENRIADRVLAEANYIVSTNKTIREVSRIFGVSKSTVHKDMREKLYLLDRFLYDKVSNVLGYHAYIKHIRGDRLQKGNFWLKKIEVIY